MLELKAQQELDELKNKYDIDFLKKIENDDKKLACLYNYVFPSLASRVRLANEKKAKYKFKCSFEECLAKNITISGKQGFLRHTISKHGHLIPGSGRFLMPKSVYFNHVSFKCNNCNMLFDSLITINSHNQQGLCRPQIASASNSTLKSQSADESTTITKTTALALESPTKTLG